MAYSSEIVAVATRAAEVSDVPPNVEVGSARYARQPAAVPLTSSFTRVVYCARLHL
ncbi:MAG TPA: hypothetical protein VJ738_15205 [Steroidobacteraceae bacterium]|nr:hypothetical protein [Steroidobacteraceae bacterium]